MGGFTVLAPGRALRRVQALAVADELTGLANRRHFFEVARRDVEASRRARRPLPP